MGGRLYIHDCSKWESKAMKRRVHSVPEEFNLEEKAKKKVPEQACAREILIPYKMQEERKTEKGLRSQRMGLRSKNVTISKLTNKMPEQSGV